MDLLFRRIFIEKKIVLAIYMLISSSLAFAQDGPIMTGSFPREGSDDILRNAFVSIKFSLPNGNINIATVNENHIKLYPTGHPTHVVPAFLTLDNALRSLILEPYGMLDAHTSYTVEITEGVKDVQGNSFQATTFSFETGERAFRKLITMNRPFGDQPEPGTWREQDVSGEGLDAPYLREATPVAGKKKAKEEPKLLKPQNSKQDLLRLVLMLYGGVRMPPNFALHPLDAPAFPDMPVAELQVSPISFEEVLLAMADTTSGEIEESLAANSETQTVRKETHINKQITANDQQVLVVKEELAVREKPSFEQLEMIFWQNDVKLGAPDIAHLSFIPSQAPLPNTREIEEAIFAMNEELIQEFQEEQERIVITTKTQALAEEELISKQIATPDQQNPLAKEEIESREKPSFDQLEAIFWQNDPKLDAPHVAHVSFIPSQAKPQNTREIEEAIFAMNEELIQEFQEEQEATRLAKKREQAYQDSIAAMSIVQADEAENNSNPVPAAQADSSEQLTSATLPREEAIDTANLLVEETIKNADRAGKILFSATAVFINEYVVVEFELPEREFVSFILRDARGDVYRTEGGYVEAGIVKRAVTLEGVPAGSYEAVVETIHQKVVKKITIVK